jgi:hypothetical protein
LIGSGWIEIFIIRKTSNYWKKQWFWEW